ncbi:MAG: hypothetical protein WCI23_05105 [Chlorobiaceae bacterium]
MASKLWEECFAGLLEAARMLRKIAITGITFFQALAGGAIFDLAPRIKPYV